MHWPHPKGHLEKARRQLEQLVRLWLSLSWPAVLCTRAALLQNWVRLDGFKYKFCFWLFKIYNFDNSSYSLFFPHQYLLIGSISFLSMLLCSVFWILIFKLALFLHYGNLCPISFRMRQSAVWAQEQKSWHPVPVSEPTGGQSQMTNTSHYQNLLTDLSPYQIDIFKLDMKPLASHRLVCLASVHEVNIWVVEEGWLMKVLSLCSHMEDNKDGLQGMWETTSLQGDAGIGRKRKRDKPFPNF